MGSKVVKGFTCKPQVLEQDKPIMFSAIQLFICDGERCNECASGDLAATLRELIKELGLNKGQQRVKVTRTYCNGACRYRQFAYTYKNTDAPNFTPANAFTVWREVHKWSDEQWKELILSLTENTDTPNLEQFRVENKVY